VKSWRVVLALSLVIILLCQRTPADAYYSNSANFTITQQIQSISGNSNSANFQVRSAGGQTADYRAPATNFIDLSGILKFLLRPIKPSYEQLHYHWRNDDGSETTATSATSGTQDTSITGLAKSTTRRLRLEISNNGGTVKDYSAQQFRLEYGLLATTCSAISSWTDVGAGAGDWDMANSTNLTDGNNTTNISTGSGGVSDGNNTFIASNAGVKDTSSQVASVSVPSNSFIEMEFSIQALSAATDGGTYCFRLTNAGSTTNYAYTVYPQATLSAGSQSLSFSLSDNSVGFGTLTSGASTYATGDTNGSGTEVEAHQIVAAVTGTNGYIITVQGATLTSGGNSIDAIGGTNTAPSVGSEQFGLRMTASGGSGSVTAPYAASGFAYAADASTASQVASTSGTSTNTTYSVRYLGNIGVGTEPGSYSTTLTYSVTGNY